MLKRLSLVLLTMFAAVAASATSVTVIDPTNGGAYSLDVTLKSGTTSTYVVTLTADLNAPNPLLNNGSFIEQAEFKIAGGNSNNNPYSNVTFLSGPSGASWTASGGPLGANGCGGNNVGFVCIDASGGASPAGGISIGSTKVFVWQTEVTLAPGVQLDSSWHIGVHYTRLQQQCSGPPTNRTCTTNLQNAGIVSLSGTPSTPPVPEPTAMAVFGLGALIVGAALRKRASA
jgi:hypothetical protein